MKKNILLKRYKIKYIIQKNIKNVKKYNIVI